MQRTPTLTSRRTLLSISASTFVLAPFLARAGLRSPTDEVEIESFNLMGRSAGRSRVSKVMLDEAEWQKRLSPAAFDITRHAGTEAAFTGAYWNLHKDGLFRCVCCTTALFDSHDKFDSGTGWP